MKARQFVLLTLVAIFALAAASFSVRAQDSGGNKKVRLGYVPVLIYAPLYVAQERGYFAKEGVEVELQPLQGGSDSVVQLAAGNFDAAVGGVGVGLLNAANRGLEFRIVAPMHSEKAPLATSLVISAKRKDEIKTVKDLKGKKVSINATGAATEYWLAEALRKNEMTFADIQLVTVAFANVPASLDNGSLDAAMLGEPLTTQQVEKGIVSVLANDFIDGFYATYLYMALPLLNDRPQVAEGFMKAYLQACRDLQTNDAYQNKEIAAIIEKYTKVPADVVTKASRPYYDPDGVIPLANIDALQQYFLTRGVLEYKDALDLTKFVDRTLAEKAVTALGGPVNKATPMATMAATSAGTPDAPTVMTTPTN
jgi:NitT/TauT family transport system substrate-binding protein